LLRKSNSISFSVHYFSPLGFDSVPEPLGLFRGAKVDFPHRWEQECAHLSRKEWHGDLGEDIVIARQPVRSAGKRGVDFFIDVYIVIT
jgi:hypothetical protein